MTNIQVYDDTAERLEKLSDRCEATVAEIVDALLDEGSDVIEDLYGKYNTKKESLKEDFYEPEIPEWYNREEYKEECYNILKDTIDKKYQKGLPHEDNYGISEMVLDIKVPSTPDILTKFVNFISNDILRKDFILVDEYDYGYGLNDSYKVFIKEENNKRYLINIVWNFKERYAYVSMPLEPFGVDFDEYFE